MNLYEAIKHSEEIANSCKNKDCANEHKQLAEWLKQLEVNQHTLVSVRNEILHGCHPTSGDGLFPYQTNLPAYYYGYELCKEAVINIINKHLQEISPERWG